MPVTAVKAKSDIDKAVISTLGYIREGNYGSAIHDLNKAIMYLMTGKEVTKEDRRHLSNALNLIDRKLERLCKDYKRYLKTVHSIESYAARYGVPTKHGERSARRAATVIIIVFASVLGALAAASRPVANVMLSPGGGSMILAAFLLLALLYFFVRRPKK